MDIGKEAAPSYQKWRAPLCQYAAELPPSVPHGTPTLLSCIESHELHWPHLIQTSLAFLGPVLCCLQFQAREGGWGFPSPKLLTHARNPKPVFASGHLGP